MERQHSEGEEAELFICMIYITNTVTYHLPGVFSFYVYKWSF